MLDSNTRQPDPEYADPEYARKLRFGAYSEKELKLTGVTGHYKLRIPMDDEFTNPDEYLDAALLAMGSYAESPELSDTYEPKEIEGINQGLLFRIGLNASGEAGASDMGLYSREHVTKALERAVGTVALKSYMERLQEYIDAAKPEPDDDTGLKAGLTQNYADSTDSQPQPEEKDEEGEINTLKQGLRIFNGIEGAIVGCVDVLNNALRSQDLTRLSGEITPHSTTINRLLNQASEFNLCLSGEERERWAELKKDIDTSISNLTRRINNEERIETHELKKLMSDLEPYILAVQQAFIKPIWDRIKALPVDNGEEEDDGEKGIEACEFGLSEHKEKSEDAYLHNAERGLFGVFDGVGSSEGAGTASRRAAEIIGKKLESIKNNTEPEEVKAALRAALIEAEIAISEDKGAGYTTATVAKLHEFNGRQYVVWASIGDSRIYTYNRKSKELTQISQDEGEGNVVTNVLGGFRDDEVVQQIGIFELDPDDLVMLCTDGITGDKGSDVLQEHEIIEALSAGTPQDAANELLGVARKRDDRTCIVFAPTSRAGK